MSESKEPINKQRLGFAVFYLILSAVLLLLCWYFREKTFQLRPPSDSYNGWRFLWCVAFSYLGFTALSLRFLRHESSPWPLHVFYYPPLLLVISAVVFSACHMFEAASGFVFYYLSSAFCLIFAFLIDRFWGIVESLVHRS